MKPKFIELTCSISASRVIVNVEQILFIAPYEDKDDSSITLVELTSRNHWFGSMLRVTETIEEIMQKIGG